MENRNFILSSLGVSTIDDLLHRVRSEDFDLGETLDVLTSSEHEMVWQAIAPIVNLSIENIMSDESYDIAVDVTKEDLVQRLKLVIHFAAFYFEETTYRPSSLLTTIESLHDILLPLDDTIKGVPALKISIARVCEVYWTLDEASAENVVTQLIPFLLLASLSPQPLDADIKRVFNIRKALLLLDFQDESIESIKNLLLRCFLHSSFLKVLEGRKFLSFLLTVDAGLHAFIIGVIKPQLSLGSRPVANAYGEILLRAWKECEGGEEVESIVSKSSIEEILQGFIHDAIHAPDRKYFQALRNLLGVFHSDKKTKDVDPMLLRVYGPILWRSLSCANAIVRAQACALFFDVFPFNDPTASPSEDEGLKQKQFDFIAALLKDGDHRVRAAAASGVCHVFKDFWECIPFNAVKQLLQYIVCTLGQDSSCAGVRYAAVVGITELLQNPLSHGILKVLLPAMGMSLHDTSEKVRVAFVKLLCEVKNIKGIQFYDIASEEHLLARFATDADKPSMCTVLTELLANSFFPSAEKTDTAAVDKERSEQVRRCLVFIKKNLNAAKAFYSNLASVTSTGTVTRFCSVLFTYMLDPSAELLEEQTVVEESDGKALKGAHPLLLRAKRRRATETGKSQVKVRDFVLFSGVLSVLLSGLNSIEATIGENTGKCLIENFSSEKMQAAFEMISLLSISESSITFPVLTEIWARITNLHVDEAAPMDNFFTPQHILDTFVQTWATIVSTHDVESAEYCALTSANASSTLEMICALKAQTWLLTSVKASLLGDTAFPMNAAVELLVTLIESEKPLVVNCRKSMFANVENINIFVEIFECSRSSCDAILLSSTDPTSDHSVWLKCIQVCLVVFTFYERLTLDATVTRSPCIPLTSMLDWLTGKVLPSFTNAEAESNVDNQFGSPDTMPKCTGGSHSFSNKDDISSQAQVAANIIAISLFNIAFSVICDALMCEHPIEVFSGYLLNWCNRLKFSRTGLVSLKPCLARLCYALSACCKEIRGEDHIHIISVMLESIFSSPCNADANGLVKNLTLVLAGSYEKGDESKIFKLALRHAVDSVEVIDDVELPSNFFVILFTKSAAVYTKTISLLCGLLLSSLRGSSSDVSFEPEKIAFFVSLLLKQQCHGKVASTIIRNIQNTLNKIVSIDVDKENYTTVNVNLSVQHRVVSLLQHSLVQD